MKNIEKQKESCHAENAKMCEFCKIINEFLAKDKKNASQRNIDENQSNRSEEESKSSQTRNVIVVNNCNCNCDETHENLEEESQDYSSCEYSGGGDFSTHYEISQDKEDYEEWLKRKKKHREERSKSAKLQS